MQVNNWVGLDARVLVEPSHGLFKKNIWKAPASWGANTIPSCTPFFLPPLIPTDQIPPHHTPTIYYSHPIFPNSAPF